MSLIDKDHKINVTKEKEEEEEYLTVQNVYPQEPFGTVQTLFENQDNLIKEEKNSCVRCVLIKQKGCWIFLCFFGIFIIILSKMLLNDMLINNINSILRTYMNNSVSVLNVDDQRE